MSNYEKGVNAARAFVIVTVDREVDAELSGEQTERLAQGVLPMEVQS